jgi:hypothetical protein
MKQTRLLPASFFHAAALLATGCGSADLYDVGLDSPEVREGAFQLSVDRESSTLTLSLHLSDPSGTDNICPTLSDTVDLVVLADGAPVSTTIIARGGGDVQVDCAFKCRELVAFAAECTPAILEMSGADAIAILDASEVYFELRDGESVLGQTVLAEAREPREIVFPEGNTIRLQADESIPAPGVGTVPLLWSHPDDVSVRASEWRDGAQFDESRVSAFQLSVDGTEHPLVLRAVGLREGEHTVFVGSSVPLPDCSFSSCNVSHITNATVRVEHL